MSKRTKGTKFNDLVRVLSIESLDWPTPDYVIEVERLGDGEKLTWRASEETWGWSQSVCPIAVGDVIAFEAFQYERGAVRRVRYFKSFSSFHGVAFHRKNK